MKVLLDACVWGGATAALVAVGHDVSAAGTWTQDPGDEEILARAQDEGRVLVTLDKDFGELAVVHGMKHCGIVRLVDIAAMRQATICQMVLERYGAELIRGAIVTADNACVRIRR